MEQVLIGRRKGSGGAIIGAVNLEHGLTDRSIGIQSLTMTMTSSILGVAVVIKHDI